MHETVASLQKGQLLTAAMLVAAGDGDYLFVTVECPHESHEPYPIHTSHGTTAVEPWWRACETATWTAEARFPGGHNLCTAGHPDLSTCLAAITRQVAGWYWERDREARR